MFKHQHIMLCAVYRTYKQSMDKYIAVSIIHILDQVLLRFIVCDLIHAYLYVVHIHNALYETL